MIFLKSTLKFLAKLPLDPKIIYIFVIIMEKQKETIFIKETPKYIKVVDKILQPLMYILWSYKKDSIQETHFWHCKNINPKLIDNTKCILVEWDSDTRIKKSYYCLHHIPFIWWRDKYVILHTKENTDKWFVWWKTIDESMCQIQSLPITTNKIKLLKWPVWNKILFFWINSLWQQIEIIDLDNWTLWDMKYQDIRLF